MRTHLIRILYALILLVAVAYGYDFASVRHRMSAQKPGDPFDVVTYPHLLAIPQKGNKVEYDLDAQSPMESDPAFTPCFLTTGTLRAGTCSESRRVPRR